MTLCTCYNTKILSLSLFCSSHNRTIAYRVDTDRFFQETMFTFFNRILEMYRAEYGRRCNNDNINTAIDQLFVCIQTYETFVFRNITSFFFQLVGQSVHTFFECIGNGNDCHAVCCIQEVFCCTGTASATTDNTGFQFFSVSSLVWQFRNIISSRFFQRLVCCCTFAATCT